MRSTLTGLLLLSATALGCQSQGLNGDNPDAGAQDDGPMSMVDMKGRLDPDSACGSVRAQATLVKAPVDVIFVIDNSGSMQDEILAVQSNINTNFANIIQTSGIDYRIIMISRHGNANPDESICVQAPLASNASCSPLPAQPGNTARFYHYSVEIDSHNSFSKIISTYNTADEFNLAPNGWKAWLRPNAYKTFVEITDDENTTAPQDTAAKFETALFALDTVNKPFGTAAKRNYIFHAIVGLVENNPVTAAWLPTDPLKTTVCTGNGDTVSATGQEHQKLARTTGGLRFPICQYTKFDTVFQTVAAGVVSGAQIACDFNVPAPPPMKEYILSTAQLEYFPGDGSPSKILTQVANQGACSADSFYIQNNHVYLCGTTCTEVQASQGARIEFLLDCVNIAG